MSFFKKQEIKQAVRVPLSEKGLVQRPRDGEEEQLIQWVLGKPPIAPISKERTDEPDAAVPTRSTSEQMMDELEPLPDAPFDSKPVPANGLGPISSDSKVSRVVLPAAPISEERTNEPEPEWDNSLFPNGEPPPVPGSIIDTEFDPATSSIIDTELADLGIVPREEFEKFRAQVIAGFKHLGLDTNKFFPK
jgi:hypothetical protein